MNNKQHLTATPEGGLRKIIQIRASMNKGLSNILSEHFPNLIPMVRPCVELDGNINPY